MPPYGPKTRYAVLVCWFIVFNEEEEEYYLWARKRAYKPKITMRDFEKVLPPGKSIMDYTPEQIQGFVHRIPISKRVSEGVLWKKVLESKAGIANDFIEKIEDSQKYQTNEYKVEEFVGWSAYPGRRSYGKPNVYK